MSQHPPRLVIPALTALAAVSALAFFLLWHPEERLRSREPGADAPSGLEGAAAKNPALAGKILKGEGTPASLPGSWPWFRGPNRDAASPETIRLSHSWPAPGPRALWSVEAGEGYAGVAVHAGRVYLMDYSRESHESILRCLSLADGKEIWRYAYPLSVKRNHGITRTVPAVTDNFVVAMDPKCNVFCLETESGTLRWATNLVEDYGTTIPAWYAGQCPLVDGTTVVLAPGGNEVLLTAVDIETGKALWKTPNPRGWKMTHSSVMPMEFAGRRMYVYCGSGGVVGVDAKDGSILWDTTDWKINIAMIAAPIPLADGRIFFSGGYNAGSLMLQLSDVGGKIFAKTVYKVGQNVFGATQQTPILYKERFFGIRPDGQLACIDLNGKPVWASGPKMQFGLGPLLLADGLLYAMNDTGKLCLFEASPAKCTLLAQADIFPEGHESWGPMALAGGRLIVRDFTRITCLDVATK